MGWLPLERNYWVWGRLLFHFSIFSFLWPFLLCSIIVTWFWLRHPSAEILIGKRGTEMGEKKGEEPNSAYNQSSSVWHWATINHLKVEQELTSWHEMQSAESCLYNKNYLKTKTRFIEINASLITRSVQAHLFKINHPPFNLVFTKEL